MRFSLLGFLVFLLILSSHAYAQNATPDLPDLPDPIQNLAAEGAQVRYMGREHGLDAWVTIKGGQEQYFYVLPGGEAFVMGMLFDDTGNLVTVDQVRRLRQQDGETLDMLTEDMGFDPAATGRRSAANQEFQSPSERLLSDVADANWVALGNPAAPPVYAFIDPLCPHCHSFIEDLRPAIEGGQVQVRMVMVGFRDNTRAQAALLLASPNPEARWFAHLDGDEDALPVRSEISQQGVQRNLAVMQSWDLSVTPLILYRGNDGSVKIVRGRPKSPDLILNDLPRGG